MNISPVDKHREWQGKIEVVSRVSITDRQTLSLAYTPGVAQACKAIEADPAESFELTRRQNIVAVVTDGTAVLGLGDIGPRAAMPVMEGKAALFKEFGDVDAFPICIDSKDTEEIIRTVKLISYSFGGINLEDISAPRCFEIERRLKQICDIPVFHDDQHGTAVTVGAALINACKVTGKEISELKAVICGAGAAGSCVADFILQLGVKDLIMYALEGIMSPDKVDDPDRKALLAKTNPRGVTGGLREAMTGADLFIGVSAGNLVTAEDIAVMAKDPIVFAMANPTPEIMPELAAAAGAAVVGTGRSDFENQINNVLAFPGIFKGALKVQAKDITGGMKVSAARAIAEFLPESELNRHRILPDAFAKGLGEAVADAVARQAIKEGIARKGL